MEEVTRDAAEHQVTLTASRPAARILRYETPGVGGVSWPRGNPDRKYALTFVRVEPYVIPKKSLTGGNTERVDTRVLQVIYAIDAPDVPLYVGQQLDVSLNTEGK